MTILVSSVSKKLIVMLSDSTITTTHVTDEQGNYFNEYETGSKFNKLQVSVVLQHGVITPIID